MEKIMICGYRDWAYDLFKITELTFDGQKEIIYVDEKEQLEMVVNKYNPDMIFFIGWSWIVKSSIIDNFKCVCLHPSPLPKYRGGSPIQNQLIMGETESAVTLFEMTDDLDAGDILFQKEFSLEGDLYEIFKKIVILGSDGISRIIEGEYESRKQDKNEVTFFSRRTEDMSEVTIEDLQTFTATDLYNKIRALQYPYPNAFIVCKDNTKLYITQAKPGEEIETN